MRTLSIALAVSLLALPALPAKASKLKMTKAACVERARKLVETKFHEKATVGNTDKAPWEFNIEEKGCSYVVTVLNVGKGGDCILAKTEKAKTPTAGSCKAN